MAKTNNDLAVIVSANTDPLAKDLKLAANLMAQFKRDAEARSATNVFRRQASDLHDISRRANESRSAFRAMTSDAMSLAKTTGAIAAGFMTAAVAGAAVAGTFRVVKDSINLAAELETNQIALETMLQSADRARTLMGDIRHFAQTTPFGQRQSSDAAKQLLAYGTAADQVLPTLRMLGHFSALAPDRMPLSDLTYIFGTLRTQGQAFARDIYQFTNRGIDLLPELAKELGVTKAEIRGLVESGRVGFNVVQRAMENMTLKGGRLFGLLDRQSESLAGRLEQLQDAWDVARIKFGQIIIREIGLKDAVKDSENFFRGLDEGMERHVAPAVRWLGQLGRAVVHTSYEFGKAGLQSGSIFGEMARDLPMVQNTLNSVDSIIKSLQEFKLKPSEVAQFAVTASQEVLSITGSFVSFVGELGDVFKKKILDPTVKAIDFIGETSGRIQFGADVFKEMRSALSPAVALRDLGQRTGVLDRPKEPMSELIHPGIHSGMDGQDALRTTFDSLREFGNNVKRINAKLDAAGRMIIDRLRAEEEAARRAELVKEMQAHQHTLNALGGLVKGFRMGHAGSLLGIGTNPLHALAAGGAGFVREDQLLTGMRTAMGMVPQVGGFLAAGFDPNRVHPRLRGDDTPPVHLIEMAKKIREEFNPLQSLLAKRADIDRMTKLGILGHREAEFAFGREVRSVADGLGIGSGGPQLLSAAGVGSAEDARLLAQFRSGFGGVKTTEDLLREIRDLIRMNNRGQGTVADTIEASAAVAVSFAG